MAPREPSVLSRRGAKFEEDANSSFRSARTGDTADCGGSNGARVRLWKLELQKLADETGLALHVLHYPPGTSKWNKIEHRMFSFISMNWRGRPLTDIRTIVELIASTKTKTGLTLQCAYDPNWYPTGVKITDQQLAAVPLTPHQWHGEWNYTISPRHPGNS